MSEIKESRSKYNGLLFEKQLRRRWPCRASSRTKRTMFHYSFKSRWEANTAKLLLRNGISFRYEPIRFELCHNLRYTPDFVLDLQRESRKVIIEPHGIMNRGDFHKFSLFREVYGCSYFLVLLVGNDSIPSVPEEAYDDIWPIEYAELLFRRLHHDSSGA